MSWWISQTSGLVSLDYVGLGHDAHCPVELFDMDEATVFKGHASVFYLIT